MPLIKMRKRRPKQRDMNFDGWGGWRRGAGRPKVRDRRVAVPHQQQTPAKHRQLPDRIEEFFKFHCAKLPYMAT